MDDEPDSFFDRIMDNRWVHLTIALFFLLSFIFGVFCAIYAGIKMATGD